MGCPGGHAHDPLYSPSIRNMVFRHCTVCIFLGEKAIMENFVTKFS